jgi:hypothetical protein
MSTRTPSQQAALDRRAAVEQQVLATPQKFRVLTGDCPPAHFTSATTSAASRTESDYADATSKESSEDPGPCTRSSTR